MRKFIFITDEGHTIAPNVTYEVNNMQVIGVIDNALNEDDALIQLLRDNQWILNAQFNVANFISYEVK